VGELDRVQDIVRAAGETMGIIKYSAWMVCRARGRGERYRRGTRGKESERAMSFTYKLPA